jgi:hypothetical protein
VFIVHEHIIAGIFQKISLLSFFVDHLESFVGIINHCFPESGYELALALIKNCEGDSFVVKERKRFADGRTSTVNDADIVPDFSWDTDEIRELDQALAQFVDLFALDAFVIYGFHVVLFCLTGEPLALLDPFGIGLES